MLKSTVGTRKVNMVSLEIADLINLLLIPLIAIGSHLNMRLVRLEKKQDKIKSSTYTKEETKDIMDLTISPIKDTTEKLIDSNEKLTEAITNLRVHLAKDYK